MYNQIHSSMFEFVSCRHIQNSAKHKFAHFGIYLSVRVPEKSKLSQKV